MSDDQIELVHRGLFFIDAALYQLFWHYNKERLANALHMPQTSKIISVRPSEVRRGYMEIVAESDDLPECDIKHPSVVYPKVAHDSTIGMWYWDWGIRVKG